MPPKIRVIHYKQQILEVEHDRCVRSKIEERLSRWHEIEFTLLGHVQYLQYLIQFAFYKEISFMEVGEGGLGRPANQTIVTVKWEVT